VCGGDVVGRARGGAVPCAEEKETATRRSGARGVHEGWELHGDAGVMPAKVQVLGFQP